MPNYKQMTEGKRHFRERPKLLGSALRSVLFSLPLAFFLDAFFITIGHHITFLLLFIALILAFSAYYLFAAFYTYRPQVSIVEELVARPWNNKFKVRGGGLTLEKDKEFTLTKIMPFKVDLKTYVYGKSNRNVFITGSSGQGKSKLTRYLLGLQTYQKLIFSFKPNDEHLRSGYATKDVSRSLPDPFANPEAFVNAFVVAFPIGSIGIQASLVPTTLENIVKRCRNWNELKSKLDKELKSAKDSNRRSALAFIQAHAARLFYDVGAFAVGSESLVLDFSSLNDDAKSFYAELVLRQIYADLEKQKRKEVLICVDEAHRLTASQFGRYHSIIMEMSREIRDKGMLWVTTQNYTDIPDGIRNQFATQFIFKTTSQNDLIALRSIEPLLSWTTSSLPKHYFVDVQFPDIHSFIPLYYYNPKGETDAAIAKEPNAVQEAAVQRLGLDVYGLPEDRPTATIHAVLLAINQNKGAELIELVKYAKKEGFITSDSTLYGYKSRKGIFDTVVGLGLVRSIGKSYELTEEGARWVDPKKMTEDAPNLGSDLHRQLMIKTIDHLHKTNMLVMVPKDGPDLIAYPVDTKKKYLWDDKRMRAYEIQTTARKDSVLRNREREGKLGLPITWVCYDKELLEEIRKLTNNEDEYLLVKL